MRYPQKLLLAALLSCLACNQSVLGADDGGAGDASAAVDGGIGAPGPDGGVIVGTPDGGKRECQITACDKHVYQCGDCLDNDGDGRTDSDDPDCLGPCDNSEVGLHPAIPGANNAPCKQDCFFDQDTGSGNDQCYWDHACDPHQQAPGYHPEGVQCKYDAGTKVGDRLSCAEASTAQSAQCTKLCGPLTPNGCDCFGCCAIGPQAAGNQGIWLGSRGGDGTPSCTLDAVGDPARCRPCQIVPGCYKPCGRCQLCIGKDTVPADCFMSGGGNDGGAGGGDGGGGGGTNPGQCPAGVQACGLPGQAACPTQWYCVTGCCVPPVG